MIRFLLLLAVLLAILVYGPIKITVNHPAAADTSCKCPPPLTPEQEEALAKQEQCVRLKRYFLNTFGGLPYDPCPTPTVPPVDGMGRPIP